MEFSRRGFIGTLVAGLVGLSANYDPLSRHWRTAEPGVPAGGDDIQRFLEAFYARHFNQRLGGGIPLIISSAQWEAGSEGVLRLSDGRTGYAKPAESRAAVTVDPRTTTPEQAAVLLRLRDISQVALMPITSELRPGVRFEQSDVTIGHHASGVMARRIEFEDATGPKVIYEVARGQWYPKSRQGRRRWERRVGGITA